MKPAFQKGEKLLSEIESSAGEGPELAMWWLGQSGFLAKCQGERVLFDPYLSDSLTRKYADTDKPHKRLTEQVVAPEKLGGLCLVTSSHIHTDHLDAETLLALAEKNPECTLVLPGANREFASERLGGEPFPIVELDQGVSARIGNAKIHGIAAAHNEVERDEQGRCRFLGFVLELGDWRIYHSGDTLWHENLIAQLLPHRPHVALLPINGNKSERRVAGNLNGAEAAALARACGVGQVVPCHYDMFEFNTESPDLFADTCRHLGQRCKILRNGEGVILESPAAND